MDKINTSLLWTLMTIVLLLPSCKKIDKPVDAQEKVRTTVTVVHPAWRNLVEYIELNGVTQFQKKDIIRSSYTGYIHSLNFKQGDAIKSGQLFCTIITKEQEALKNISNADSSMVKFQKPLSAFANGSGIITGIIVLQGDYVSEGDVLANVNEPSSLVVQVNVPFEYNHYVGIGKPCEIILPDGKSIRTAITNRMPTVDAATQSQSFIIRLPNESIPENLNVRIRFPKSQKNNLLCLPTSAIQTDEMQREFWVMQVKDDSLALKIPVKIGLQNDSLTEIISGSISNNDNIILEGAYELPDSSIVIFHRE